MKSLARVFLLFVLLQMLCLCNKMDLTKEHTALGRNLLSFSIDGSTVTQGYTGGIGPVQFQRGIWYDSPCTSFAKFYVDDEGYMRTRAVLVSPRYQELRMKLPTREIIEGVTYKPEVSLYYKYLASIKSGQYTTVRKAEFRKATITEASITINTFYPDRDAGLCCQENSHSLDILWIPLGKLLHSRQRMDCLIYPTSLEYGYHCGNAGRSKIQVGNIMTI